MSRQVNKATLDLICGFEGCRLSAYLDQGGLVTIGVGHTGPEVHLGQTITQAEAEQLLSQDLSSAEDAVTRLVSVPLNDNQFGALVSFVFNVGAGNFASSTLLKLLNAGLVNEAAEQFVRWDHVAGVSSLGLLRRRQAEQGLFLS
jgi:lysozyme